jgi:hypothetical protein
MRRVGVPLAASALVLVGMVGTAAADPPTIDRYPDYGMQIVWPNDDPSEFWRAARCDFPIRYEDHGKGIEILFADGSYLGLVPGLHATVTNLETGASISLPVNGSVRITESSPDAQGHYEMVFTYRGPTVNITPGQLSYYTGQKIIVREFDANDEVVSEAVTDHSGHPIDICAALSE